MAMPIRADTDTGNLVRVTQTSGQTHRADQDLEAAPQGLWRKRYAVSNDNSDPIRTAVILGMGIRLHDSDGRQAVIIIIIMRCKQLLPVWAGRAVSGVWVDGREVLGVWGRSFFRTFHS
ncbi:hypothetical protein EYF80_018115 [Liparis tanakae]|uniref:Uncharacterized protein n=1 Tax=Liparis tanakae TaxID=230148 RepID=A0A4Z2I1A5_9TELE|nr:hypothetical protein EYF80_018115 [Liparis tanakae]